MPKPHFLVLTGSARALRRSPAIAGWAAGIGTRTTGLNFEVVDVHDLGLTLDDEPALPALGRYEAETTRAWSARVSACAGLVIVTPQYNWGYPAPLKNALDHLYAEWRDKPATLITFGGHGGGKCAEQLHQVLKGGLKMRLTPTQVELTLPPGSIPADDGRVDPQSDFADSEPEVAKALAELAAMVAVTSSSADRPLPTAGSRS